MLTARHADTAVRLGMTRVAVKIHYNIIGRLLRRAQTRMGRDLLPAINRLTKAMRRFNLAFAVTS